MTNKGASYGEGGRSRKRKNDPRARRAAAAQRTSQALGAGLVRDKLGRPTVDMIAVLRAVKGVS